MSHKQLPGIVDHSTIWILKTPCFLEQPW